VAASQDIWLSILRGSAPAQRDRSLQRQWLCAVLPPASASAVAENSSSPRFPFSAVEFVVLRLARARRPPTRKARDTPRPAILSQASLNPIVDGFARFCAWRPTRLP